MKKVNKLLILLLLITLSVSFTGCSSKSSTKFTLTVKVEGSGRVEPVAGTHQFDSDTSVDLTAIPETGWQFKEWFGEVAEPQEAETKVLMDKDKTVKAKFEEIPENTIIESVNLST
ncbi:MAG TPA: hypothetical protein VKY40_03435 [Halanaerobiales bacterium]|nr:hypothetical protein [Halanaerobiales bacterium]